MGSGSNGRTIGASFHFEVSLGFSAGFCLGVSSGFSGLCLGFTSGLASSHLGVSSGSTVRVLSPSESESVLPKSGLPTPGVTNLRLPWGRSTFLYGVPSFL